MVNGLVSESHRLQKLLCAIALCIPCLSHAEEINYQYDDMDRLIHTSHQDSVAIDYSYDALGNFLVLTSSVNSLSTPPAAPGNGTPQSDATGVNPTEITFSWSGVEADAGNPVFYDLYLGLDENPPLYKSGLDTTSITLSGIPAGQVNYWKVVARDKHNISAESPVWSFTTSNSAPQTAPDVIRPVNNFYTSYQNNILLQWGAVADPNEGDVVTYDVYLSESPDPALLEQGLSSTHKWLSGLDPWKTYYWKIVASDNHGAQISSPVWSFSPLDSDSDGFPDDIEDQLCIDKNSSDTDGDLLSDAEEDINRNGVVDPGETAPCNADTDGDAMPDGWEVANQFNPLVDDALSDADGDGWFNIDEYMAETDPNASSDMPPADFNQAHFEGGIFDIWYWKSSVSSPWVIDDSNPNSGVFSAKSGPVSGGEISRLETAVNTPDGVMSFYVKGPDSWGVALNFYIDDVLQDSWSGEEAFQRVSYPVTEGVHTFRWEYARDFSSDDGAAWIDDVYIPGLIDEDGDGIKDSWEYIYFGGLNHNMTLDTDGDGLTDQDEGVLELDPTSGDTDADGMPDLWEVNNNCNPAADDAPQDADLDGFANYAEYLTGTNPQDPQETPAGFGFESGRFAPLYWLHGGDSRWTIDETNPHAGVYAIKSGAISGSQVSSIETRAKTSAGAMFFYVSISSEFADNRLSFYIDDVLMDSWFGEESYQFAAYPITEGVHTFRWEYRDAWDANGATAAWIDDVYIPGKLDADTDTDSINDAWEYAYFGVLDHDMTLDTDGDGLTDQEEATLEIDPTSSDTDADGMPDLWEVDNGCNPALDDAWQDADMDGTINYAEYFYSVDPQDGSTESGFESGGFAPWYWMHGGDSRWTIDEENPHAGVYAIKSGVISDSQTSSVETRVNTTAGAVFFYVAVSSESSYDQLNFYIDDLLMDSWSGEVTYQFVSYAITKGVHRFRWEYTKDSLGSSGADAAWIDDLYIPGQLDEDVEPDGINDAWEYAYFGVLDHDMTLDTDGDGLTDQEEATLEIDPTSSDTDSDGMPDLWEFENGCDPAFDDALEDADMDGISNYDEYLANPGSQGSPTDPGFESGRFAPWYWVHGGDSRWTIDEANPYGGMYAIMSGVISDNQTSSLETTLNTSAGEISFYVAVSSEYAKDQLSFYIDDLLMDSLSGEETYQFVSYSVTEGVHRFRWEYAKDSEVSEGSDTAWIDDVSIPGQLDEDVDYDGIDDAWEYTYFGMLDHDVSLDTDGDGLIDQDEADLGLDPTSSDTDGDGMPDLWELDNGFDPTFDDAQQDADMDGVSNYDEYLSGTDPQAGSTEPGFESGIFAPWYWIHGGDSSWTIDTENLSTGTYAIKSGAISDGQTSSVETRVNTLDSTVFFLVSVSSEFSSDQLNFYIDDVLQESWSGEEAFQAAYYPITEGVHTFRWEYAKDGSGASGADAAWIYDIYIPTLLDEDTDADDVSDTWEYAYFGTLGHDMSLDTDGDGVIDLDEYANGTDPLQ